TPMRRALPGSEGLTTGCRPGRRPTRPATSTNPSHSSRSRSRTGPAVSRPVLPRHSALTSRTWRRFPSDRPRGPTTNRTTGRPSPTSEDSMAAAGKIKAEVRRFVANRERRGLGTATPERIMKSGGHSSVGADGTQRIVDSPFDRAHAQGRLGSGTSCPHNERRFRAGQKYRHHWYHAGLAGNLQSPDLNRIFASDPSSNSAGMARSEAEAWHRQKYREAV